MDNKNLYPELLEEAIRAAGIPDEEAETTIKLLTFSLIAHL